MSEDPHVAKAKALIDRVDALLDEECPVTVLMAMHALMASAIVVLADDQAEANQLVDDHAEQLKKAIATFDFETLTERVH